MPENNHAALYQGLKLYLEAMRRYVRERLSDRYGDAWWESGVRRTLTDAQRQRLDQEFKRSPGKTRLDLLDPPHLSRVIGGNFDAVFGRDFGDFKETQSHLARVEVARNRAAHPRSGDLPADEVGYDLYAMAWLLKRAGQPEAEEVERLRSSVLGIGTAPAPAPSGPSVPSAPPGALPYWWQVCEPHEAFTNPASIDESLFAATLGGVHAGAARDEYKRPEVFFAHTYFTESLRQMVRDVAARLAGRQGAPATELETPFGGGKTHALLTLYHLFKSPDASLAVPGVREALGEIDIPRNVRVLVFDGYEFGTEPMQKENGASVWTLWGELAFQADPLLFHRLVMASDERGEAPGNAVYRQVLTAAAPCLILIDELVSYLVKLRFSNTRRTQNLYRQTVQFVQELLQEVGNVPGVAVVLSLPKSQREFGGLDPQEIQQQLGVVPELQARADRVVSKRTPVSDEEVYTLISRRLFRRRDPEAAEQVARAYRDLYQRTPNLYDPSVLSADYLQQQREAYPLHPELIDVLYKKWSTASDFPRTRNVLQLLAAVVADQWVYRREAYTIQSAHVNLERERIRTRIISAANAGPGYEAVIAADIIGGDAHADALDQRRGGDYARHHIARGVATTLLMHSFGGGERLGAQPWELRLGTVAPNVGPEYVTDLLGVLEQSLWYVHREGERLRFHTRFNIYRMIAQLAGELPAAEVAERLQAAFDDAVGRADGFRALPWAGSDGAVQDRPELTVAVLEPRYAVEQDNGSGPPAGREAVERLWDRVGGGLREWRNALILVAPDRDRWRMAEEAMREVMAHEKVLDQAEAGKRTGLEVTQRELEDLRRRAREKQAALRTSIVTAYRWVFYPEEDGLHAVALPVPATQGESIVQRAVDRLADATYSNPKVLRKMGAVYFNAKLAPRLWKDPEAPLDLAEVSRRFPQWTYLPMLPDREATLRACIREGIREGLWAVAVGEPDSDAYQALIDRPEDLDEVVTLFDGSAWLVRGALLERLRAQFRPAPAAPPEGPTGEPEPGPSGPEGPPRGGPADIPPPPRRLLRVRLRLDDLSVAKTSNLQPYLFKVLQEQDAGARLTVTIEVTSTAGIAAEVLDRRIVEAFEQLGISVRWEEA